MITKYAACLPRLLLIAALLALPLHAATAAGKAVHIDVNGLDVAVWAPRHASPRHAYPLIVFSHGFKGCNGRSSFLNEALAAHGYLVMAPVHADNRCGLWQQDGTDRIPPKPVLPRPVPPRPVPPVRFDEARLWDDTVYTQRRADIEAVIARALAGPVEGVRTDPARIGLAGHSLGGYAAMAMAGAWPSWKDARIGAVLALSPYAEPFLNGGGDLEDLDVPVMIQGGTKDTEVTPVNIRRGSVFDRMGGPKIYVEFKGTDHKGWTDRGTVNHGPIVAYGVAFFDCALKQTHCQSMRAKRRGVSGLRTGNW